MPEPIVIECRGEAGAWIAQHQPTPRSIIAAVVIMLLWMTFFWMLWSHWGATVIQWFSATRGASA